MPEIFFIADNHFSHTNIIKYCNRPFSSTQDHDESLISNWNEIVKPQDMVFHLGDFGFFKDSESFENIFNRLNGQITLIKGNHDRKIITKSKNKFQRIVQMFTELTRRKLAVLTVQRSHDDIKEKINVLIRNGNRMLL